jgi:hypothetical protein
MVKIDNFIGDWTEIEDDDGEPILPTPVMQIKDTCAYYTLKYVLEARHRIKWTREKVYDPQKKSYGVDVNYLLSKNESRSHLPSLVNYLIGKVKAEGVEDRNQWVSYTCFFFLFLYNLLKMYVYYLILV